MHVLFILIALRIFIRSKKIVNFYLKENEYIFEVFVTCHLVWDIVTFHEVAIISPYKIMNIFHNILYMP